jgi:predicted AAA+ superfamily ATPase
MKLEGRGELILVIDEIQKLKGWSEVVKKEWDDYTFNDINLKVILLGSSRVLLQKGLADLQADSKLSG